VFGPGVGGIYHFSRHVAVALEARGLAGVPDFALLGDVGASLQLGF
jgi:hypothetical protein